MGEGEEVRAEDVVKRTDDVTLRDLSLHGALAAASRIREHVARIPSDAPQLAFELTALSTATNEMQVPGAAVTRPLLGRLEALAESVEQNLPEIEASMERLTKHCEGALRPRDNKERAVLETLSTHVKALQESGNLRPELQELSKWLGQAEITAIGAGNLHPDEQMDVLLASLRSLDLPERLTVQVDYVEDIRDPYSSSTFSEDTRSRPSTNASTIPGSSDKFGDSFRQFYLGSS
eukprot:CAMPEP_0182881858 /NCGR_PEP_ID=MMETSP0034_2-20130328/17427_1 /TAXON_ID=156128 /ORGANISM="Nephroselmis pyriformis, Strain CCMP717" /LENGTH=234 /DNA_ID=CAMNT_0025014907 /DNA_START=216 /DNA_END=917 /DNA_ORIENTATION=-